jgi:hypothetical protein
VRLSQAIQLITINNQKSGASSLMLIGQWNRRREVVFLTSREVDRRGWLMELDNFKTQSMLSYTIKKGEAKEKISPFASPFFIAIRFLYKSHLIF